ncbi:GlxA family transcriptional regulator [Hoeflea sp. TYP-13]|uniref:GlxA family transcriptional regulator n=1 Tax=Hoeflea sp. TYP-13 TaxID=3230023 RepID=UPI0034C5D23B
MEQNADSVEKPKRYIFLLLTDFSILSLSTALETLRISNRIAGRKLFEWVLCSEDGQPARSSLGTDFEVHTGLEVLSRDDTILICGGAHIDEATTQTVVHWLRREARKGLSVGGLCTGAYTMAKAGLLDGRRATIHWENQDSFREAFPQVDLTTWTYTGDENRYSTAGGTSGIDLMLHLVSELEGEELADAVAQQLNYSSIRVIQHDARVSVPDRINLRHTKLSHVIHEMEQNIEDGLSSSELAKRVNISTRQLERLFQRYLGQTPKRYFTELRLQRARNLLEQTDMKIIDIAVACGFSSPAHFSKLFRRRFDNSPHGLRKEKLFGRRRQGFAQ